MMNTINLFNSVYQVNEIKQISETNPSNFSIFDSDLPFALKKYICECCLCRAIRGKFSIPKDRFCILDDSLGRNCLKNECQYDAKQVDSHSLCENCVRVVSMISSKQSYLTKSFECLFPSCQFKSKHSFNMKRHHLIHLNV